MVIYCAHKFGGSKKNFKRATKIVNELQKSNPENTYISPLHAFSFLKYKEIDYDKEIELCLNLLSKCDVLYVLSEISEGVRREINCAIALEIPIRYMRGDKNVRTKSFM